MIVAGLYYIYNQKFMEGFDNIPNHCPNLLMKKDNVYYLYNTKKNHVPGVNPIQFKNLEEYKEFIEWLRGQGLLCPILYLEQTYDTQGQRTYRMYPDPDEQNAGLPVYDVNQITKLYGSHDPGNYPGYDPQNQYIGSYTPLDKLHNIQKNKPISDNPMDPNWGGPQYTREMVKEGKYKGDEVYFL
jgi:hypothetical protein